MKVFALAVVCLLAMGGCDKGAKDEATSVAKDAGKAVATAAAKVADRAVDVAASETVTLRNTAYDPQRLPVKLGKRVRWVNRDGFVHTVMSENNSFHSGDIGTDKDFSFRFTQAGTYKYYCQIHGKDRMSGTIVVE